MAKSQHLLPAIHPGEILRAEFMEPLQLSMNRLALDLRVPVTRIAEIVHERRGISPDTALRLARYFNTSPGFWLNLQSSYDLEVAQDKLSRTIEREVRPSTFAAANAGCPTHSRSFANEWASAHSECIETTINSK